MVALPGSSRGSLLPLLALACATVSFMPVWSQAAEGATVDSPLCVKRASKPEANLRLVSTRKVAPRTMLYAFRSAAVGNAMSDGLVRVRVIVPTTYASSKMRRYPVMYHLHGTNNSPQTWPVSEVKPLLGANQLIFVQPDGGRAGFYSDWYGTPITGLDLFNGAVPSPPPAWETFFIRELLPWIDGHLRTNGHRSVAGSSMGGFGAMAYPARHRGLFDAAASFSGALDLDALFPVTPVVAMLAYDPCIWGDRVTQAANWKKHNPTQLVAGLRGLSLFVASGNGLPGRHDNLSTVVGAPLEILLRQGAENFVVALRKENIPVRVWFYGNGTHPGSTHDESRKYDYDDLVRFLPQAMRAMRPSGR